MEILQLRYFITAAHMQNLSHAAEYHRIPQSAMSKTVSRLEKELGVALFDRAHNRLQLNESGRLFLEQAERAIGLLDDAITAVQDQQKIRGEIRLLVLENRRTTTACIAEFKRRYPDVTFRISHTRTEQPFEFDLCIAAYPPQKEGLCAAPLLREELQLAVSAKEPLALCKSVEFSQLRNERFVLLPEPNSLIRLVSIFSAQCGFEPQIAILCDDPLYVRNYVAMRLGVTIAPMVSWKGLFGTDTVQLPLFHDGKPLYRTTNLFWHENRYMPLRVQLLRDLLHEQFSAESV